MEIAYKPVRVDIGPAGPAVPLSTSWDPLPPSKDRLLGWEGQWAINPMNELKNKTIRKTNLKNKN